MIKLIEYAEQNNISRHQLMVALKPGWDRKRLTDNGHWYITERGLNKLSDFACDKTNYRAEANKWLVNESNQIGDGTMTIVIDRLKEIRNLVLHLHNVLKDETKLNIQIAKSLFGATTLAEAIFAIDAVIDAVRSNQEF
jgi:hypothetical protein